MTSSSFNLVTHVIFDIDGLLLDTEKIYTDVFKEIVGRYGKEFTWDLRQKTFGRNEEDAARQLIEETGIPLSVEEFRKTQRGIQRDKLKDCQLMPGAERLVCHLHNHGVPMALATSSSLESVEIKFTKFRSFFNCFNHVVSGSDDPDVKKGKPEPDVFLVCASRFPDKPDPSKCLVFEDAPTGELAARRAGMQTVMVPDPDLDPEYTKDATLALKSLCEFKPELFCLPPFNCNT